MATYNYSGLAFPWDGTLATFVEPKNDNDVLWSSVFNIIMTFFGERVMLPEFGSGIQGMVFEPGSDDFASHSAEIIRTALETWETRIELLDISVKESTQDPGRSFDVAITFRNVGDPVEWDPQSVGFTLTPDMQEL